MLSKTTNNTLPYTRLYDLKLDMNYLRAFGSLCFPLVTKAKRNKFDLTASFYIFLEYSNSHKAYKCLKLKDHEDVYLFKDYKINNYLPQKCDHLHLPIRGNIFENQSRIISDLPKNRLVKLSQNNIPTPQSNEVSSES